MSDRASLTFGESTYPLNVLTGTEDEKALDVRQLRKDSGLITFDDGYGNTGSCESSVTFIDGDKGILRYRGYDISELAEKASFLEVCLLLLNGELPSADELSAFESKVSTFQNLPPEVLQSIQSLPSAIHPMGSLASGLQALGGACSHLCTNDRQKDLEYFDDAAALIIATLPALAAASHRQKKGEDFLNPSPSKSYCENFLTMMFGKAGDSQINPSLSKALDLIFLLHADHEQNCSTSTCRMIASGGANPFASLAGAVSALWGPLHGGANMAVIKMLNDIHSSGDDGSKFIQSAKEGKSRLMGFGHRVYRNRDPRAEIMKVTCHEVLDELGLNNEPLFKLANTLEKIALEDEYFIEKKLYPNVDFYSGIVMKALGIPNSMFTAIFALARTAGWIAHWHEMMTDSDNKIGRPRQIYTGRTQRDIP